MSSRSLQIVAGVFVLLMSALPLQARASTLDAMTFTCAQLNDANASDKHADHYGASTLLYWLAGYHATEGQGTIVDFDQLIAAFNKTSEYCKENAAISVFNASAQYLGSNAEEPGGEAVDLALITCQKAISTPKEQRDGLGQILMWLSGYHAGYAEDTVIDFDAFEGSAKEIGAYCAANPHIGLYAASDKFMGAE